MEDVIFTLIAWQNIDYIAVMEDMMVEKWQDFKQSRIT